MLPPPLRSTTVMRSFCFFLLLVCLVVSVHAPLKQFISRDKRQLFCLVVALTEPHVPWVMGDASAYYPCAPSY